MCMSVCWNTHLCVCIWVFVGICVWCVFSVRTNQILWLACNSQCLTPIYCITSFLVICFVKKKIYYNHARLSHEHNYNSANCDTYCEHVIVVIRQQTYFLVFLNKRADIVTPRLWLWPDNSELQSVSKTPGRLPATVKQELKTAPKIYFVRIVGQPEPMKSII